MAIKSQSIYLVAPEGRLETLLSEPSTKRREDVAIICHPHPLFGGTMHNKIVTTLHKAYDACGYQTVRFNFRGVGDSAGEYGEAEGELADLMAVIAWVKETCPEAPIHLAGFSFGGYVALRAAALCLGVASLITVAPAVTHFDVQKITDITCPWTLLQGQLDEVVSEESVLAWLKTRKENPQVILFPEAGHFFHGKMIELRERLVEVIEAL